MSIRSLLGMVATLMLCSALSACVTAGARCAGRGVSVNSSPVVVSSEPGR